MAKILIVDDERSIRTTLSEFVKEDGHETYVADGVEAAMQIMAESVPDVVVTDIILPRTTGMELLAEIHGISADIQVIMITGEPTVETASLAVRNGAFDYLAKPISRDAIRAAVARAVRVKLLADERRRLEAENIRFRHHLEEEVEEKTRALQDSERRHRAVVDNALEAVFVVQRDMIRFANPSATAILSIPPPPYGNVFFFDRIHPEDRDAVSRSYEPPVGQDDRSRTSLFRVVDPQGENRWLDARMVYIDWEGGPAWLSFASDVTSRRRVEMEERRRQERMQQQNVALVGMATNRALFVGDVAAAFRLITETSARVLRSDRVGIWLFDDSMKSIRCVDLYEAESEEHAEGMALQRDRFPNYFAALSEQHVISANDVFSDPRTIEFANSYLDPFNITSMLDAPIRLGGELVGVICHEMVGQPREWTIEDESFAGSVATFASLSMEAGEAVRAERALERSESEYRGLFEDSPAAMWHEDFSGVKRRIDALLAQGVPDFGAYLAAHPEFVDECISLVRIVAVNTASVAMHRASGKEDLLQGLPGLLTETSRHSFAKQLVAIARGATVFEDETIDQTLDGDPIHVSIRWMVPPEYRETMERVLVSKMDITQAVEAEFRLRLALGGTIEAIGLTTETRDPYTAGHQRRVTQLAEAMALEMGVDTETVEATRAAGLMHDIGKMAVPAEILSKPSSLTEMEMALIHAHPQVAYDILKTVAFPWPVADIVLQHHERIDGSGYPLGLKGEEIRLEACILSVADVVEAMASHRPYRPSVGIDAALREIESGRGVRYNDAAVDACLRLFREDRFAFLGG